MIRALFVRVFSWFAALIDHVGNWYIHQGLRRQMWRADSFFSTMPA